MYVDGFVVPVPKKNLDAYRRLARKAGKVWREHGALQYVECVADDVKRGKLTSFPQSVKLKPGEVVCFSWIVYKSRRQRDQVNKKVMAAPRLLRRTWTSSPCPSTAGACSGAASRASWRWRYRAPVDHRCVRCLAMPTRRDAGRIKFDRTSNIA